MLTMQRSGNNNGNRNNGNRNGPRPPRGPRPEGQQGPRKPREPRERQERPREKVQAVAEGVAAQATEVEAGAAVVAEGAEHTASRKANASLVDLDAEFFEGAQPAVASASSSRSIQRQNQNQRKASERTRFQSGSRPAGARGPRTGNRNGPNNGPNNNNARPARAGDRGPRPPMRAEKAAFIKSVTPFDPKTQVQRDTSMAGLFGVGSILAPPTPRARDPQSSIWALAQGMDRAAGK
jgi:hypothetical protein